MGIDPGTNFMGYAIIKVFGKNQKPELVVSGIVDMIKITDEQLIEWKRYYQVITHKLDGDNIPYISGKEDTHPLDVLYDHLWRGRQK